MPVTEYDRILKKLSYIFYADNGNADTYDLPREKLIGNKSKNIKGWFETFTERFGVGENPVAGKYNADLFENVDEKFTDINIPCHKRKIIPVGSYACLLESDIFFLAVGKPFLKTFRFHIRFIYDLKRFLSPGKSLMDPINDLV